MSKRTYADIKAELDGLEADALAELAEAKQGQRDNPDDEAAVARAKAAKQAVADLRASQREGREGISISATNDTSAAEPAQEG